MPSFQTNSSTRRPIAAVTAALLGIGIVGLTATPAFAITVTTESALNQAIADNEVEITIGQSITLTAPLTVIDHDVTIVGNGHTIDAAGFYGFQFTDSTFTVSDLTVTDAVTAFRVAFGAGDTGSFTDVSTAGGTNGIVVEQTNHGDSITIVGGTHSNQSSGIQLEGMAPDATASVTSTQFSGHSSYALYLDPTNTMRYTVTDVTISETTTGILANASDTAILTIANPTITDAATGINGYSYGSSSTIITDATITAGPTHNSGVSGYGLYLFGYDTATVEVVGGNVAHGVGSSFDYGLGLYVDHASSAVVSDSSIDGHGDGIYAATYGADASFQLLDSTITNSVYRGIYVVSDGSTLIDGTTFDSNGEFGIYLSAHRSGNGATISATTSSNNGIGGLDVYASGDDVAVTVVNSTFSGSRGVGGQNTVRVNSDNMSSGQQFSLLNSTVTNNTNTGETLVVYGMPAVISHSIVSGNTTGDFYPQVGSVDSAHIDIEWSVIGSVDTDGGTYAEGDGVVYTNTPGLSALTNNGGATLTHAVLSGSPALNTGNPGIVGAPAADQRGENRIVGVIDIGAFEAQPSLASTGTDPAAFVAFAALLLMLGAAIVAITRRSFVA